MKTNHLYDKLKNNLSDPSIIIARRKPFRHIISIIINVILFRHKSHASNFRMKNIHTDVTYLMFISSNVVLVFLYSIKESGFQSSG